MTHATSPAGILPHQHRQRQQTGPHSSSSSSSVAGKLNEGATECIVTDKKRKDPPVCSRTNNPLVVRHDVQQRKRVCKLDPAVSHPLIVNASFQEEEGPSVAGDWWLTLMAKANERFSKILSDDHNINIGSNVIGSSGPRCNGAGTGYNDAYNIRRGHHPSSSLYDNNNAAPGKLSQRHGPRASLSPLSPVHPSSLIMNSTRKYEQLFSHSLAQACSQTSVQSERRIVNFSKSGEFLLAQFILGQLLCNETKECRCGSCGGCKYYYYRHCRGVRQGGKIKFEHDKWLIIGSLTCDQAQTIYRSAIAFSHRFYQFDGRTTQLRLFHSSVDNNINNNINNILPIGDPAIIFNTMVTTLSFVFMTALQPACKVQSGHGALYEPFLATLLRRRLIMHAHYHCKGVVPERERGVIQSILGTLGLNMTFWELEQIHDAVHLLTTRAGAILSTLSPMSSLTMLSTDNTHDNARGSAAQSQFESNFTYLSSILSQQLGATNTTQHTAQTSSPSVDGDVCAYHKASHSHKSAHYPTGDSNALKTFSAATRGDLLLLSPTMNVNPQWLFNSQMQLLLVLHEHVKYQVTPTTTTTEPTQSPRGAGGQGKATTTATVGSGSHRASPGHTHTQSQSIQRDESLLPQLLSKLPPSVIALLPSYDDRSSILECCITALVHFYTRSILVEGSRSSDSGDSMSAHYPEGPGVNWAAAHQRADERITQTYWCSMFISRCIRAALIYIAVVFRSVLSLAEYELLFRLASVESPPYCSLTGFLDHIHDEILNSRGTHMDCLKDTGTPGRARYSYVNTHNIVAGFVDEARLHTRPPSPTPATPQGGCRPCDQTVMPSVLSWLPPCYFLSKHPQASVPPHKGAARKSDIVCSCDLSLTCKDDMAPPRRDIHFVAESIFIAS